MTVLRLRFIHAVTTQRSITDGVLRLFHRRRDDGGLPRRRRVPSRTIATSRCSSGGSRGWCPPLLPPTLLYSSSPCMSTIVLSISSVIPALLLFWVDSPFSPSKRIPSLVLLPLREFCFLLCFLYLFNFHL